MPLPKQPPLDPDSEKGRRIAAELPELLTAMDLAAALKISRPYAYRLMASGDIETVRIGHAVRTTRAAVRAYIAAHTTPAFPPRRHSNGRMRAV